MVLKEDQLRVRALIKDTITLLCKNGLHYRTHFSIEALIGITLDEGDVFLVNINEKVQNEAAVKVQTSEADTCVASPAVSDHSDTHYAKDQSSSMSYSEESSLVGRQPTRDKSDTVSNQKENIGSPKGKHKRKGSSEGWSFPSTARSLGEFSGESMVKMEDSLPDGSSFLITTGGDVDTHSVEPATKRLHHDDGSRSTSRSMNTPTSQGDDSSDVVVVKKEAFSDPELEFNQDQTMLGPGLDSKDSSDRTLSVPSGRTKPLPGSSAWQGTCSRLRMPITSPSALPSGQSYIGEPSKSEVLPISTLARCSYCSYLGPTQATMKRHMCSVHAKTLGNMCKLCSKSFSSSSGLRNHLHKKHKDRYGNWLQCFKCGSTYLTTGNFEDHLRTEHGLSPDEYVYKCSQCSVEFKSRQQATGHMRLHATSRSLSSWNSTCTSDAHGDISSS